MKIKIFFDDSTPYLEHEINEFIKDKKVIDMKFNKSNGSNYHYVLVMYEESP